MSQPRAALPPLTANAHASHCIRCLQGLGPGQVEYDTSRMVVGYYGLAALDILGLFERKVQEHDRLGWCEWIWEQQIGGPYGTGFRSSPFLVGDVAGETGDARDPQYDKPSMIMTYVALLMLSILRDEFTRLNRAGISKFLKSCQQIDGSFASMPGYGDPDLRLVYCAFSIAKMLNDWSGVDVPSAVAYVRSCRSYEGGFGQAPLQEAVGGTTYCAVATLALAPVDAQLSDVELRDTVRWLILKQDDLGFHGRTEKPADACYSFWCGAALEILGHGALVDRDANALFLASCQFKHGGIAKAPGELSDPYHTYMALACLAVHPPAAADHQTSAGSASWKLAELDPLLNGKRATIDWALDHIPAAVPSAQPAP